MLDLRFKHPRRAFRRGPSGLRAIAGRLLASSLTLLCVGGADAFVPRPAIGTLARMEGTATATMSGHPVAMAAGADVFAGEAITTGAGARIEIVLADKTVLTLGERAQLTLDRFVFDPLGATRIGLNVNGAFRYISGKLGVGATRVAEVTTPFATIGARGTDFWGGPIDGHFGVVVLEGTVTVANRGRTVVLRHPNEGTDFAGNRASPGAVHPWARPKLDRALATIAFR